MTSYTSSTLKNYMKIFLPALTLASNKAFFSLETFESWVSSTGYELYKTWLKNAENTWTLLMGQELVDNASTKDIKEFHETIRFILLEYI